MDNSTGSKNYDFLKKKYSLKVTIIIDYSDVLLINYTNESSTDTTSALLLTNKKNIYSS